MVIDEEEIAEVLAQWTGIPVHRLTQEETARLLEMENELHKRIVGQNEAITACLLYTSPSPRDKRQTRMPSSA